MEQFGYIIWAVSFFRVVYSLLNTHAVPTTGGLSEQRRIDLRLSCIDMPETAVRRQHCPQWLQRRDTVSSLNTQRRPAENKSASVDCNHLLQNQLSLKIHSVTLKRTKRLNDERAKKNGSRTWTENTTTWTRMTWSHFFLWGYYIIISLFNPIHNEGGTAI